MSVRCCTRCGHEAAYDGQGLWWCGNDDCDNNMPIDGKRILSEPPRSDLPPRAEWGRECDCGHFEISHHPHCLAFTPGPDMKAVPCSCAQFAPPVPPRAERVKLLRDLAQLVRSGFERVPRRSFFVAGDADMLDAIASELEGAKCDRCGEATEPVCCNGNCPNYGAHDSFYGSTPGFEEKP